MERSTMDTKNPNGLTIDRTYCPPKVTMPLRGS